MTLPPHSTGGRVGPYSDATEASASFSLFSVVVPPRHNVERPGLYPLQAGAKFMVAE